MAVKYTVGGSDSFEMLEKYLAPESNPVEEYKRTNGRYVYVIEVDEAKAEWQAYRLRAGLPGHLQGHGVFDTADEAREFIFANYKLQNT